MSTNQAKHNDPFQEQKKHLARRKLAILLGKEKYAQAQGLGINSKPMK